MLVTDADELEESRQAEASEVRHAEPELAPPLAAELHQTHEAVADLDLGIEHQQLESSYGTAPDDFAQDPLIVDQQAATRLDALRVIQ